MSIADRVNSLSDAELRAELEQLNVAVGPIVGSTRALYRKVLLRILRDPNEDKTFEDSVGGYEASMEYSDHEDYSKQPDGTTYIRQRLHSNKGNYSGVTYMEARVNKENKNSKAITIQLYLIVILMVAILCLCVYLYLNWNSASTYDAIEAAAKAALEKTNQN